MVWEVSHLRSEVLIPPDINIRHSWRGTEQNHGLNVGIIGGGPKGLYALERLCHSLTIATPEIDDMDIFWFNERDYFGTGPNYRVDQEEFLLINYAIGNIDSWNRSDPNTSIVDQPTFVQWIQQHKKTDQQVNPYHFASRALVGAYLRDMLSKIISVLPNRIRVHFIQCQVRKLSGDKKVYIHCKDERLEVDAVLLCTGHCYKASSIISANNDTAHYFSKSYPISQFSHIPDNSKVGVIGLGLTFIDVCLALTEGRGGVFDANSHYLSNRSPEITIYPFSASQVPIMPRPASLPTERNTLQYMTSKWLGDMMAIKSKRQLSFEKEILPVLTNEMRYAYYSTLLGYEDLHKVQDYIATLDPRTIFGWDDLFYPHVEQCGDPHQDKISLIKYMLCEAEKGVEESPLMAAAGVWRLAMPAVAELYNNLGFTPKSHEIFDKKWFGRFNRTAFGPPIINMKKILSLAEKGIIRFDLGEGHTTVQSKTDEKFYVHNDSFGTEVSFLIDARIGRPTMDSQGNGLYDVLYRSKWIEPLNNDSYSLGCPHMDNKGQVLVGGKTGAIHFYGTCTEGNFLDNDSLSRTRNDVATHWVNHVMQLMKNNLISDKRQSHPI